MLSRIRERYDQSGDNAESVAHGLRSTARIITGAALIMMAVFTGFASGRLGHLEQMGFAWRWRFSSTPPSSGPS